MSPTSGSWNNRHLLLALLFIVLVGAALRMAAAMGGLWVDEIWSLNQIQIARDTGALKDWIALFFHDNTHALNTLYLLAVGPEASMFVYRLFSVACGTAAILAAGYVGWRRSPWEGCLLAGLTAVCYPLVHYSGEARGYGPMVLAAFAAFGFLEAHLRRPSGFTGFGFVAAALFGLAAHLTFGVVLTGLGVWALAETYRKGHGWIGTLARQVPLFGPPFVVSAAYAAVAVGGFVVGGVTFIGAGDAVGIIAGYTIGLPAPSNPALTGLICGGVIGVAIAVRKRQGDGAWPAFLVIVLAFPAGVVLAEDTPFVLPRYFLAVVPVFLIVAARSLADAWHLGGLAKPAAAIVISLFVIGNGLSLSRFLDHGRGGYVQAVRLIANAGGDGTTVTGYPDFSVATMFRFHAARLGWAARLRYRPRGAADDAPADWLILGYHAGARAPGTVKQAAGLAPSVNYTWQATFPHWGLSGDTWSVYQRQSR